MNELVQSIRRLKRLKSAARSAMTATTRVFQSNAIAARLLAHHQDPEFEDLWVRVRAHTLLDMFRAKQILDRARAALALPGDFIECGVANGGISLLLASFLERTGSEKRVFLCDGFQGLPEPDRTVDKDYAPGEFAANASTVAQLLEAHGVRDRCVIVEGWFEDTLPTLMPGLQIALAHIDCDLYRPALTCIQHVAPQITTGGALVFDDYLDGSEGIFRAVNAHVAATGEQIRLGPTCQATVIKGELPQADAVTLRIGQTGQVDPAGFLLHISMADLRTNHTYQAYLGLIRDDYRDRADDLADHLVELSPKPSMTHEPSDGPKHHGS